MKRSHFSLLFGVLAIMLVLTGCGGDKDNAKASTNVQVNVESAAAADGLDLQALGALAQQANDAEDLEKQINQSSGINNLDLDANGEVDYLKVSSYGEGDFRGFSFAVEMEGGEEQHVAEIQIEKSGGQATMEVSGNEQIYGSGSHYSSRLDVADIVLLSWLYGGHYRPYYSPYHYGVYPGYYHPYRPVPYNAYSTRTRTVVSSSRTTMSKSTTSTIKNKSAKSPYKGKAASNVRASLKQPTKSQKSFQARNPKKKAGSGGFGKKANTGKSSSKATSSGSTVGKSNTGKSGSSGSTVKPKAKAKPKPKKAKKRSGGKRRK
jgi:hypothetical protein